MIIKIVITKQIVYINVYNNNIRNYDVTKDNIEMYQNINML